MQDNYLLLRVHQVKLLQQAIEKFLSYGDDDSSNFEIFFKKTTPESFQWQAIVKDDSYSESGDL